MQESVSDSRCECAVFLAAIELAPRMGAAYAVLAHRLNSRNRVSEAIQVASKAVQLRLSHAAQSFQVLGLAFFTLADSEQEPQLIRRQRSKVASLMFHHAARLSSEPGSLYWLQPAVTTAMLAGRPQDVLQWANQVLIYAS